MRSILALTILIAAFPLIWWSEQPRGLSLSEQTLERVTALDNNKYPSTGDCASFNLVQGQVTGRQCGVAPPFAQCVICEMGTYPSFVSVGSGNTHVMDTGTFKSCSLSIRDVGQCLAGTCNNPKPVGLCTKGTPAIFGPQPIPPN